MVTRWIIGLLVLQGVLAWSPVRDLETVHDEEWASFHRMMRDPAYRLPTTTRPHHYEVSLTPYFDNVGSAQVDPFTFDGTVSIYLNATQANVTEIVMHCNDLNVTRVTVTLNSATGLIIALPVLNDNFECEMPYSFLRINLGAAMQENAEYVVTASFRGNIQTNMRGFYRSWYNDSTGRRWMGTTQFQPGHARQAFPCYDEPSFKATFDITINREPDFSPTISNMPIRSTTTLSDGRISETFHTTPVTSTYLLAFIVSHYQVVATTNSTTRSFDIYARDNAGSTGDWSLEIGELLLEEMERYTDYPYYSMAENMNMKQAAIPDFSAGAMENWGLLTYREALILYDPQNSNHFYRQRVANIVSHEIAHMWFGNLVTCAWWDVLWLNEGFARFYQYFLTDSVASYMGYSTRFIVEQHQTALLSDSLDTAHPLTDPTVSDPTTVSAHFSTITYAKGAAVLRMTQYLLGQDTYVKGLRSYLRARQFDIAAPEDLFQALQAAADEDSALDNYSAITIEGYMKTWSEQAGHPLLTVNVNHDTGIITVTQARFERNTGVSSFDSIWQVPVTWTRGGSPDFNDLKPQQILTQQTTQINRGSTGLEWVLFNKQSSGFYRVNYDDTTWELITDALRGSERTTIHELNRAQIVDDVFQLARSNIMPYNQAFGILSFLEFEDAYAPWIAAINGYEWLLRRLAHDEENLRLVEEEIIRLSAAVTARLGYDEGSGGTYMDDLQRMYVMQFLCNVKHPDCVSNAVTHFTNFRNGVFLPANMRPWVYCVGLREGSAEDFNYLWNRYTQEDLASEMIVMLNQLGCTKDNSSIWFYLDQIVQENDYIREQDNTAALSSAIYSNEENTMIAFEWLKNNVQPATAAFGSLATPISYIAARLLNEQQIEEFQTWLDENREEIGTAYNTGVNGIASTRNFIQWTNGKIPEMRLYLDNVGTNQTTDSPVEPSSANVVFLSAMSLVLSLMLHFTM